LVVDVDLTITRSQCARKSCKRARIVGCEILLTHKLRYKERILYAKLCRPRAVPSRAPIPIQIVELLKQSRAFFESLPKSVLQFTQSILRASSFAHTIPHHRRDVSAVVELRALRARQRIYATAQQLDLFTRILRRPSGIVFKFILSRASNLALNALERFACARKLFVQFAEPRPCLYTIIAGSIDLVIFKFCEKSLVSRAKTVRLFETLIMAETSFDQFAGVLHVVLNKQIENHCVICRESARNRFGIFREEIEYEMDILKRPRDKDGESDLVFTA